MFLRSTRFQVMVWKALLKIPSGTVVNYGEVVQHFGRLKNARAVGSACGTNRIGYLIPCHRGNRTASATCWLGKWPGKQQGRYPDAVLLLASLSSLAHNRSMHTTSLPTWRAWAIWSLGACFFLCFLSTHGTQRLGSRPDALVRCQCLSCWQLVGLLFLRLHGGATTDRPDG